VNAAVNGNRVTGNVARALAAKKEDRLGELLLQSVAIEWNGIMIGGADLRRMDRLRHGGIERARSNGIDPDAQGSKLDRLLLGQVREASLACAVRSAQRRGSQP